MHELTAAIRGRKKVSLTEETGDLRAEYEEMKRRFPDVSC